MEKIPKKLVLIITLVLLSFFWFQIDVYAYISGENVLDNPGFEDGFNYWQTWAAPGPPPPGSITVTDLEKYSGNYSAHLVAAEIKQWISMPRGTYLIGVRYKIIPTGYSYLDRFSLVVSSIDDGETDILLRISISNLSTICSDSPCEIVNEIDLGGGWRESLVRIEIPEDHSAGTITIWNAYGFVRSEAYIDDVWISISPLPGPGPGPGPGPVPGPSIGLTSPLSCEDIPCVIEVIINFLFYLGSALIVLMIIIGAIMFITSAGDPQRVSTAKRLLFWSVIGIAIILLAKGVISVIRNILGGG